MLAEHQLFYPLDQFAQHLVVGAGLRDGGRRAAIMSQTLAPIFVYLLTPIHDLFRLSQKTKVIVVDMTKGSPQLTSLEGKSEHSVNDRTSSG